MAECRTELSSACQDLLLVSGQRVRNHFVENAQLLSVFGIMKRVRLFFSEPGLKRWEQNNNAEGER